MISLMPPQGLLGETVAIFVRLQTLGANPPESTASDHEHGPVAPHHHHKAKYCGNRVSDKKEQHQREDNRELRKRPQAGYERHGDHLVDLGKHTLSEVGTVTNCKVDEGKRSAGAC